MSKPINLYRDESGDDNLFENTYLLFLDALHSAMLPAADQLAKMGGLSPGVAWELRADLLNHGTELLTLFAESLGPEEQAIIAGYIGDLRRLPSRVFDSTATGEGEGLLAPEWTEHRKRSTATLQALEPRVRAIYTRFNLDLSWFERLVR